MPITDAFRVPKVIILVTGESCAGKDHFATTCVFIFTSKSLAARAISISDAIKREFAAATNTDLDRLLHDRPYKEQHRRALRAFFQAKKHQRPQLLEANFLNVVYSAVGVDVLLITGMRDDAPVATFSHLVPGSRLIEVQVQASEGTRTQRGSQGASDNNGGHKVDINTGPAYLTTSHY